MLKFTKMQGAGNDYIYINGFETELIDPEHAARVLSDRRFGIGGDGLVLMLPSKTADVRMRMFNADGSEGRMCGNAIRCVGKLAYERGYVKSDVISVETLAGIKKLRLSVSGGVVKSATVDMGRASFEPGDIPFTGDDPLHARFTALGTEYETVCLSVGNPHCVMLCGDVETAPVLTAGPVIEKLELFPEGVNAEFVHIKSKSSVNMRVWERGSGETFACGTGATATVAACVRTGLLPADEDIAVNMRGGTLVIRCSADGALTMTGPAEYTFEGVTELV